MRFCMLNVKEEKREMNADSRNMFPQSSRKIHGMIDHKCNEEARERLVISYVERVTRETIRMNAYNF